ncbi:hypothetical protein AB0J63_39650 [Streptosporangium canum]|uniref:hypothetical protein n=1 Tax=Streptosporangium canum TaxID=324952 RepID=UPI00342AACCA
MFKPVAKVTAFNPKFTQFAQSHEFQAARDFMNEIFADFPDVDHSFIREFQTAGFSARVFELALFAYIQEQDLALDRSHAAPDFVLHGDLPVAIEVTTTNPAQDAPPEVLALLPDDLKTASNAFVFQIAKALSRKLQHHTHGARYWDLPHVAGIPFVVAVGAFHDQHAQLHPMGLVGQYLYGKRDIASYDESGTLVLAHEDIHEHHFAGKTIPSGLFRHPEGKHLSGVLFSNNHTISLFNRIGAECGLGADDVAQLRVGTRYNFDPNASEPELFAYVIGDSEPEEQETFSQGLHLFVNRWADTPLPPEALPGVTVHELQDDGSLLTTFGSGLNPFGSKTLIFSGQGAWARAQYGRLKLLGLLPPDEDRPEST